MMSYALHTAFINADVSVTVHSYHRREDNANTAKYPTALAVVYT